MPRPAGAVPMMPCCSSSAISSSPRPSAESTSRLCCPRSGAGVVWKRCGPRRRCAWEACCALRSGSPGGRPLRRSRDERAAADRRPGVAASPWRRARLRSRGFRRSRRPFARRTSGRDARRSSSWCRRRPAALASSSWPSPGCRARRRGSPTARRWPPRSPPSRRVVRTRRARLCGIGSAVPRSVRDFPRVAAGCRTRSAR